MGFAFPNNVAHGLLFLSLCSLGVTSLPLNPAYTRNEFMFYLEDTKVSHVIILEDFHESSVELFAAIESLKEKMCISIIRMRFNSAEKTFEFSGDKCVGQIARRSDEEKASSVCLILHTSGTTSRPKGVMLSQHNLMTSVKNIQKTYEISSEDRSILVMPLFHIHGIVCGFLTPMFAGSTIIIPSGGRFSASQFWRDASRFQITWFTAVPTILHVNS